MRPDVMQEFFEAGGRGEEWFDGAGYSFRRLPKLDNGDLDRLARKLARARSYAANRERELEGMRKWRERNREYCRELCRRWYAAAKRDPKKWQARLDSWRRSDKRKKKRDPEGYRARANARSRRYRARVYADPRRHEEYKARNREQKRLEHRRRMTRLKRDPEALEAHRAKNRERARRYYWRRKG